MIPSNQNRRPKKNGSHCKRTKFTTSICIEGTKIKSIIFSVVVHRKFDALPKLRTYRLWTRGVVTVAVFCIVYFIAGRSREKTFARQKETIPLRTQLFPCSDTYLRDIRQYPDCEPRQCGRFVIDTSVDKNEVDTLLDMVKTGMSLGGSSGGASILDLHSGALSKGEAFVNVYKIIAKGQQLFTAESLELYRVSI